MEDLLRTVSAAFLIVSVIVALCSKFKIPGIVGLIVAGALIGPHGIGILEDRTQITLLSDFGIVLLMFSIGLEFDRDRLRELRRSLGAGMVQIGICIIASFAICQLIPSLSWQFSIVIGFLVSHTSSTLMLTIYGERGELSTASARLGVGISITQDLAAVPMLVAMPLLALGGGLELTPALPRIAFGAVMLMILAAASWWLIPPLLRLVVHSRSRELIVFFLILICLGASWATFEAGLSAALGAFIAGLALAGSHYSHQIHAEVSPLRDILISLFFISVGMLVTTDALTGYAHIYIPVLITALAIKFFSGFIPVLLWGYPLRIATEAGIAIAQIGEFSLVLMLVAKSFGLLDESTYQVFTIVVVLSMLFNPFWIAKSQSFYRLFDKLPWPPSLKHGRFTPSDVNNDLSQLSQHVVIAGYGLNGKNLVRTLKSLQIPYTALELDPRSVNYAQSVGERVYYGDCTRPEVLARMGIRVARVFVLAISDLQATRRAIQVARLANPALQIIVRTRYAEEIEHLYEIGANEVIPEEFETSLEILARTLHEYQVPRRTIDQAVQEFRSGSYKTMREASALSARQIPIAGVNLEFEIEIATLKASDSAVGHNLKKLELPVKTGVIVLALKRQEVVMSSPSPEEVLQEGDTVIMVGKHSQLLQALDVLQGKS